MAIDIRKVTFLETAGTNNVFNVQQDAQKELCTQLIQVTTTADSANVAAESRGNLFTVVLPKNIRNVDSVVNVIAVSASLLSEFRGVYDAAARTITVSAYNPTGGNLALAAGAVVNILVSLG